MTAFLYDSSMSPLAALRATTLAALAGGCFAPEPPAGVVCGPVGDAARCPSGQACVASGGVERCIATDGPDAGGGGGDGDGDGVADGSDNCPTAANPDQNNEDGDALGDACDPCPAYDANGDGDGDGVGEGCDPHPSTPGDRLVAFAGFGGAALPAGWTASVPAAVTVTGGGMTVRAAAEQAVTVTFASPAGAPRIAVTAEVALGQLTATEDILGAMAVVDQVEPGQDRGVACQLSGLADGSQRELRVFNTATATIINNAAHAFEPAVPYLFEMARAGSSYTCKANNPSLVLAGTTAQAPANARTGVRVRGAHASYRWVMIVSSP